MPRNKILAIHSRDGTLLQRLSDDWMTVAIPGIKAPYEFARPLLGLDAVRYRNPSFSQTVRNPDIVLVIGLGHGREDRFEGFGGDVLYSSEIMPSEEVKDKIFHLLSCSTGSGLDHDFRKAGCRAFIGYRTVVPIDSSTLEWADTFLKCDAQIDIKLAAGQTVALAIQTAKAWFKAWGLAALADELVSDPEDGSVSLPPLTPSAYTNVITDHAIQSHELAGPNVIPIRVTKQAPAF